MRAQLTRRDFLKLSGGAAGGLMAASFLAACGATEGGNSDEDPTAAVTIALFPGYEDLFQEHVFDPYMSDSPGVTITPEPAPASQVYASLLAAEGSAPPVHGGATNDTLAWTGLRDGVWNTLTTDHLPNLANVPEGIRSEAAAPWAVNVWGITYNPEFVPEGISSWEELYDPKFEGRIGMWPAYLDAYIMAAHVAGASDGDIEPGIAAWEEAKSNIGLFISSVSEAHQALDRGEIWVAPNWLGVTARDAAQGMNLAFSIPDEGAVMNTYMMQVVADIEPEPQTAMTQILNLWLENDVQTELFNAQYLTPVTSGVEVDLSNVPDIGADWSFTAEDAVERLYRPDYETIGENQQEITEEINERIVS